MATAPEEDRGGQSGACSWASRRARSLARRAGPRQPQEQRAEAKAPRSVTVVSWRGPGLSGPSGPFGLFGALAPFTEWERRRGVAS